MPNMHEHGLGELLRHLTEILDRSAERLYADNKLDYRPRYTPIMRALAHGPCTVNEITARLAITQGAVSQTLKLMEADGLIQRKSGADSRQYIIALSRRGRTLLKKLESYWRAMFVAIKDIEAEIDAPLLAILQKTIAALETNDFATRIHTAMRQQT